MTDSDSPKRWRQPTADFLPSFVALQAMVADACAGEQDWQLKIAAGIHAALEFAAVDPPAAHALTIDARRQRLPGGDREQEVIAYFAGRLTAVAPTEKRFPITTDRSTIESIALVVRGHLLADTVGELPSLAAEFTYVALLPYIGLAEARRWAELFL